MTLSDILAREVQLEFYEAIAMMRAVADGCAGVAPSSAPELDQIDLLADGSVQLLGSTITDDPVGRLIEMLQTLMGAGLRPAQLTSLMEGSHSSVEAFSEALAYFERPNRSLILQDLYSRASGQPRLPAADELMASLRAAPESADPPEATRETSSQRRMLIYGGAAVAGAAAITLVLALLWRDGPAPSNTEAPPTLTSRLADGVSGVAGAVGSAVKSIGARIGSDPPPPTAVEAPAPPAASGAGAAPARGSSKGVSSTPRRTPPSIGPAPGSGGLAVQGRVTDRAAAPPAAAPEARDREVVDALVYSAGAPGVIPPVGVRPHVPKELPPGIRPENIARIEIVVDSQGTVESVKLVGPPRIQDAMLLSAAKAWRFRPANRNGSPVSYRMTVSVAR